MATKINSTTTEDPQPPTHSKTMWPCVPILTAILIALTTQSSALHIDVPLYLDAPQPLHFLASKAQSLINTHISTLDLRLNYSVTFHDTLFPTSYVVSMGFSRQEAFFISPHGRDVLVFQTDALIVHNEVPLLIKDVVTKHLLVGDLSQWDSATALDTVACVLDPVMNVTVRIMTDMRWLNWEDEVFADVFTPVLNELQRLVYLNVAFEVEKVDDVDELDVESLKWGHDQLRFYLVLSNDPSFRSDSFIQPQQGGVVARQLDRPLTEMDQIGIVEQLTGQLFRVLGMTDVEPKSPFVRLDSMIRHQLYKNYVSLPYEEQQQLQATIDTHDFDYALQFSWQLLETVSHYNITPHNKTPT